MAARFRNNVPFLMNQIVSRVHANSVEEFRALGFNPQTARVLISLLNHPGAHVSQLAEITTIDDSTLSHMLRRLARRGLLERRREEHDNRFVTVHFTLEGKRAARACKNASDRREARMLCGLSAKEAATLRGLLGRVFETVRDETWTAKGKSRPRKLQRAS